MAKSEYHRCDNCRVIFHIASSRFCGNCGKHAYKSTLDSVLILIAREIYDEPIKSYTNSTEPNKVVFYVGSEFSHEVKFNYFLKHAKYLPINRIANRVIQYYKRDFKGDE